MVHLEFVVLGVPISNQVPGANLQGWRTALAAEAENHWHGALLTCKLKGVIINFHLGERPTLDVDNMSKPIFDAMEGIVYENDRQIRQAEITHVPIDAPFRIKGASSIIVSAVQAGRPFVFVRFEDPVDPFPLPT